MKTVLSEDGGNKELAARLEALMPALSALGKAQKEAGPDPGTQNQQQASAAAESALSMVPVSTPCCSTAGLHKAEPN